ncbi:MAG: phosphoribosylformylglycinamidine synthase subunit PurQ [candidate division WOR-3 bacterium]|nr:phosphoribosylformylglycinamidine synthase subunit PurQ [candidate division WOR-3 bacterium]
MTVKVGVLFTAGTNCDEETIQAFELAGAKAERILLSIFKKRKHLINNYHILCIPGGFTYGDYISAGKILANELKFILQEYLMKFINDGKLILGICNGFQVLVKAGILPGIPKYFTKQTVTLDVNDSNRFECRWIYLKANNQSPCIFTKEIEDVFMLPVAHAEGKFVVDSKKTLNTIKENNLITLTYVDEKGKKAGYPYNPNGSIENIAGICDITGRIFGLMPHPERFVSIYQHPAWHREKINPIGLKIFNNAIKYAQENL